ncbi:MAG: discoidin domain-containing protein [Armatimonadota bacterium]|nr:discoidin domain-containing protein [Armatimonadota bacterium]MDW8025306.1 discoidin domain-containing protein [Armatimonadota bacterium]
MGGVSVIHSSWAIFHGCAIGSEGQHRVPPRLRLVCIFFVFVASLLSMQNARSYELASAGRLKIAFDKRTGRINSFGVADVLWQGDGGFSVFDVVANKTLKLYGALKQVGKEQVEFECTSKELSVSLKATFVSKPRCIEVSGVLTGDGERAVVLSFSLPIDVGGWYWWDDMRRGRMITNGVYRNVVKLPMRGEHSPYPLCAVCDLKRGVGMGIDLSMPVMHRFLLDASLRELRLEYDFGLSKHAKAPCKFRFAIFAISEPGWGMRSAMMDYYELFSSSFVKRTKVDGIWMPFTPISKIEHPEDFGFAFHEGTSGADYDEKHGIYTFVYVEPWSARFYLPLDAPRNLSASELLSHEAVIKGADKRLLEVVERCAAHSPEGTLHPRSYTADWAMGRLVYDFLVNADPDISGDWTKARLMDETIIKEFASHRERGVELDGVYFDGFGEWVRPQVNERKDHWSVFDFPLSFSWETKRPCQITAFGIYEYLQRMAEKLHADGKLVMANGYVWAYIPFAAHWIDVGGNEIRWTRMRDDYPFFDYRRFLAFRRPYLPLNNEDFEKVFTAELAEEYFDWALFYGFFPSCFSPTASSVGNYWNTPQFHNRDRHLFRIYIPLLRMLSSAGWNPITQGHPSGHGMRWFDVLNSDVLVERFGDYASGKLFFTVHNRTNSPIDETIQIDYKPLGIDPKRETDLCIAELLTGHVLAYTVDEMHINIPMSLPERSTRLLWVGKRSDILGWALAHALELADASHGRLHRIKAEDGLLSALKELRASLSEAGRFTHSAAKKDGDQQQLLQALGKAQLLLAKICISCESTVPSESRIFKRINTLVSCAVQLAMGVRWVINWQARIAAGDTIILSMGFRHGVEGGLELVQSEASLSSPSHGEFARSFHTWRKLQPNADSWASHRLSIPKWVGVEERLHIKSKLSTSVYGVELTLERSEELKVVEPYAMRASIVPNSAGLLLELRLTNNTTRGASGKVRVSISGRELSVDDDSVVLPALRTISVIRKIEPKGVEVGYHRAQVSLTLEGGESLIDEPSFVYVLPSANLLLEGGFEGGDALGKVWKSLTRGRSKAELQAKRSYSGKRSILLTSPNDEGILSVGQEVNLKQPINRFVISSLSYTEILYPLFPPEGCAIRLNMQPLQLSRASQPSSPVEFVVPINTDAGRWQLAYAYLSTLEPIGKLRFEFSLERRACKIWLDEAFFAPAVEDGENLALSAKVSVDSSFAGYNPKTINDGCGSLGQPDDWARVAWASAETEQPHWVQLDFGREVSLRKLIIWWALDRGKFYTSRSYAIQAFVNGEWHDIIQCKRDYEEPFTVHIFEKPLKCNRLRVLQPIGGGNRQRPNLMWVAEVEAYE